MPPFVEILARGTQLNKVRTTSFRALWLLGKILGAAPSMNSGVRRYNHMLQDNNILPVRDCKPVTEPVA